MCKIKGPASLPFDESWHLVLGLHHLSMSLITVLWLGRDDITKVSCKTKHLVQAYSSEGEFITIMARIMPIGRQVWFWRAYF